MVDGITVASLTDPERYPPDRQAGAMEALREVGLASYDRFIGLKLPDASVDCCITKSPCGGEKASKSPVDRGKRGIKRSIVVDAKGVP